MLIYISSGALSQPVLRDQAAGVGLARERGRGRLPHVRSPALPGPVSSTVAASDFFYFFNFFPHNFIYECGEHARTKALSWGTSHSISKRFLLLQKRLFRTL